MASVWGELKRRNVVRVAIAYAVVAWLSIEVSATTFPMLKLPEWAATFVTVLLIIGFPVAVIFAWAYELTPEGLKKEKDVDRSESITHITGRKVDFVIIGVLAVALVLFAVERFILLPDTVTASDSAQEIAATEFQHSIAVLPFVNMSDDPGNEYFSDGLSEEILNLLAKIPELKVIGRTSSFAFKGKNEDLRIIGQTLGVTTLLEGSVRKSGNEIRITAQLNDVSDGSHIWSETYDRTLSDVFAVQDDVAAAIIEALQIHVGTVTTRGRPTENMQAYGLFLKARVAINNDDYQSSAAHSLKAVEFDSNFAEAWELLAHSYFNQLYRMDATEAQELTFEAAARALAIDPDLVLARALYESASFESFSMLRQIEALERAVRKQPGNPWALQMLFWDLMINGYLEEGVRLAKRYVEVEPLMLEAHYYLVHVLFAAGRFSEAIAALEVTEQLGDGDANWSYGVMYLVEKRDDVAIAYFEAWLHQHGYSDTSWVRDLVTGARNPATGLAYLDRRIPEIVASMPEDDEFDWQEKLFPWYLYLGFLDRYFETILDLDLTDEAWSYAFIPVAGGTIHRRAGFTAHPKYLEVVEAMGIIDVWEQRGPPDFCEKTGGEWVCE